MNNIFFVIISLYDNRDMAVSVLNLHGVKVPSPISLTIRKMKYAIHYFKVLVEKHVQFSIVANVYDPETSFNCLEITKSIVK